MSAWRSVTIGDVATLRSGTTPSRARRDYFTSDGTAWVKTGDLTNGEIVATSEKVSATAIDECRLIVHPPGTVLVAMYGGLAQIGRTGILAVHAATNQAITAIDCKTSEVHPHFLLSVLNQRVGDWRRVAGSSRKDPNITREDVRRFRLALPSVQQQESISRFIQTVEREAAIRGRLLDEKRRLKVGLMQQLLEVRGAAEAGNWKGYRLGELFAERIEINRPDLPLLSITSDRGVIRREDLDRRDSSNPNKRLYRRIAPGDIGYNTMRMWQGVSALSMLEGIVSPAYTICTPNALVDVEFAAVLFKYAPIIHLFRRYSQGLVDDTLNLGFREFAQIRVCIPPIEEQRRIGELFRTINQEVRAMELLAAAMTRRRRALLGRILSGQLRIRSL
jgi:type I restriction enzyme S subunit